MRQENQRLSFLPHHLVTFLKDRLVFVDVALEIVKESNSKNQGENKKFVENTQQRKEEKGMQAADIIITPILSFAAAAVRAVLPPISSIALLRDESRPSVV